MTGAEIPAKLAGHTSACIATERGHALGDLAGCGPTRDANDRQMAKPASVPSGGSPALSPATSFDRQRAFEAARRAAMALCSGLVDPDHRHWRDCVAGPETIERYRWLIVAMGVARDTPGGRAIAELARKGFVVVAHARRSRWPARVRALDAPGIVWFGAGLPARRRRPWSETERHAARLDVTSYAPVSFVSAHMSVRIMSELRREGHRLG